MYFTDEHSTFAMRLVDISTDDCHLISEVRPGG
jgi:hypothetical protein